MVKHEIKENFFFKIMNTSQFMLITTILGFLSVIGISIYRLATNVSEKQEDIYASSTLISSILFNFLVYVGLVISLRDLLYIKSQFNFKFIIGNILLLLFSPLIISLAIIWLNHSNLAYKKERSNVLWILNITSGVFYSLMSYLLYAMLTI